LFGKLVRLALPYMRFLFVSPELCLRLPSDSTSRWTPLPLANTSYCHPCSGLPPPSYYSCWAHEKQRNREFMRLSCSLIQGNRIMKFFWKDADNTKTLSKMANKLFRTIISLFFFPVSVLCSFVSLFFFLVSFKFPQEKNYNAVALWVPECGIADNVFYLRA
jgi:hypothetical protein